MDIIKAIFVLQLNPLLFHNKHALTLLRSKRCHKFYVIGVFDQREIQVEVHAIEAILISYNKL